MLHAKNFISNMPHILDWNLHKLIFKVLVFLVSICLYCLLIHLYSTPALVVWEGI